LVLALWLGAACGGLRAENWPNWRGPHWDGSSTETGLPVTFSKTENVKWTVEMPGSGASTPVIWGDHVFLTSADGDKGSVALCFDRVTGKERWRREFDGVARDDRSNFASPSATTDGERVVFFFGNGLMGAYDFAGQELWSADIAALYGDFCFQWTFSSSPVLHGGTVFLQVLQRDEPVHDRGKLGAESFLLALDARSGKEVYRHVRPSRARKESLESFATPVPLAGNGRPELVIAGGDVLTGHDPETGAERWRWGTWNPGHGEEWWRLVPSPVFGGGVILACAPKNAPIYAVKAGLEGTHEGQDGLAWATTPSKEAPLTSDVATPLFYQGRFYVIDHGPTRSLSCIDPASGKVIYTQRTGSREKFEASPTGADGKIYLVNQLGDVFVVQAGDEFKVLHQAEMGTSQRNIGRASIAVSQGNLFVRTDTHLYCIGR
jgi:outer membrane protein assembly factor BamB